MKCNNEYFSTCVLLRVREVEIPMKRILLLLFIAVFLFVSFLKKKCTLTKSIEVKIKKKQALHQESQNLRNQK